MSFLVAVIVIAVGIALVFIGAILSDFHDFRRQEGNWETSERGDEE